MNDTWYDMGFDADMSWMYNWKRKEKKMTREEAWRRTKGYLYDVLSGEEADEIIKALEQQPCDDCISKQAVDALVDELARAISDERCCISRGRSTAIIMQDILDLPSVNPQPCEDAIGRQAALELFTWTNTKEDIWYGLKQLPSVTISSAEPFKGMTNGEVLEEVFGSNFYPPLVFCADWYKEPYEGEQK